MKNILLLFILAISLTACLDQIELDLPEKEQETIVVQGYLRQGDPSIVEVYITNLFDFTVSGRDRINVRFVTLHDEKGNSIELKQGLGVVGAYELTIDASNPDFQIREGGSYHIKLATFDGRSFESKPETLRAVPDPSDLRVALVNKTIEINEEESQVRPFVQYEMDTPLNLPGSDEEVYLKWRFEQTFRITDSPFPPLDPTPKTCYVTRNAAINNVSVATSEDYQDSLLNLIILEDAIGFSYSQGLTMRVFQQSLTEEAYRYWKAVADISTRSGNMFEAPPGKVPSNIFSPEDPDADVTGYFYVTQEKPINIGVSAEFAGNPPRRCPPDLTNVMTDPCLAFPLCCDCLSDPQSDTTPPEWWVE